MFFQTGNFRTHCRCLLEQGVVRLVSFGECGVLTDREFRLAEKFLEECIHSLEAVRVSRVISQQNVMLQKVNVVFPTVEKNQPIFEELVEWRKILSEESAASLGNYVLLDVDEHLRNLLSDAANYFPPSRLQLGQPCFDHMRLLAALKILAPLPNPFLPFQNQVGELIGELLGEEFQKGKTENKVNLNIFVILRLRECALEQIR